jgi:hypothetical protein
MHNGFFEPIHVSDTFEEQAGRMIRKSAQYLPFLFAIMAFTCAKYTADPAILFLLHEGAAHLNSPTTSISLIEGDPATGSYTVELDEMPIGDVTVHITTDGQVTANPSTLTFTTNDWQSPKTITVSAVDDTLSEGIHYSTIRHSISGDPKFSTLSIPAVRVKIRDNDISPVGSVQTGVISMGVATQIVPINPVVMNRAFVLCSFSTSNSDPSKVPTCQLTASNQVTVENANADPTVTVRWYVVEFGAEATVQRGSVAWTVETSQSIPVTAVNPSKAFVIVYARSPETGRGLDHYRTVGARLTDATTLELTRNGSGNIVNIEWQVVEIAGATVQSGETTLGNGTLAMSTQITAVDPERTFIIQNIKANAASAGVESEYLVCSKLTNPSTLTFSRGRWSNPVDISWFAIEMGNTTFVRSGSSSTAVSTDTIVDATQAAPVDITYAPAGAVPFFSSSISGTASNSDLDSASFMGGFTSSTNLRFERGSNGAIDAAIEWFAVEFR